MSDIPQDYILRVLSGPHTGGEIELLPEKTLLIGKGTDCDVILQDEQLNEHHAKFEHKDEKFFCIPQEEAKVYINGKLISESTELGAFQSIICGTTLLAIGPKNELWPNIEIPQIDETTTEDKKDVSGDEKTSDTKSEKNSSTTVKSFPKYIFKIIFALSCFATLIVGKIVFSSLSKSKEKTQKEESTFPIVALKKSIETALKKYNAPENLTKISLSGKYFDLQCYLKTTKQKTELKEALKRLPNITFRSTQIYTQERILKQANEFLAPLKTVQACPENTFDAIKLKGYLYAPEKQADIKKELLENVPGLTTIKAELKGPEYINLVASKLLIQHNLMGLLKLQPTRMGLMITGNIKPSDTEKWKKLQVDLRETFEDTCKVLTYVSVVNPEVVKRVFFPASILSIAIPQKEKPWIDLKNGERYYEGMNLSSGYKISFITPEAIQLEKGEELVTFSLIEL